MKWYITGGHTENGIRDDSRVAPLVSYGDSRVEAIANSGITVWSEEEWRDVVNDLPAQEESDRQATLLALANLALARPGWDWMLGNIAEKLQGRVLFEEFKRLNNDGIAPRA